MAKSTAPASSPSPAPKSSERSNGPVFTCRHRALKAAVWRNDMEKGPMFNTTLCRSYKDEGGEWKESASFGYDDVLIVAELLRICHGFILREMAKLSEEVKD